MIQRWCLVATLAIAFGYIEAAVVVYLRQIFYPRVLCSPSSCSRFRPNRAIWCWLRSAGRPPRSSLCSPPACCLVKVAHSAVAHFMTIFAVWDIFYYVWLKVILDWPASILDWDVLFLIPVPWAGPVLTPILVSIAMLVFAALILYRDSLGRPIKISFWDRFGFFAAGLIIVVSFCVAGKYMMQPDYAEHFSWAVFGASLVAGIVLFAKCVCKKEPPDGRGG